MTHSIKSLKKFLSKLSILFLTLSFIQSCALSPGMAPTDITDEEFFNNLELTFHKIEEVNFEDLPNQSEKYKKDVKNLQELVQENRYRYILGSGDIINVKLVDNDEINSDFPLILSTGRLLEHWHTGTMTRKAIILNDLEPDPIVFINEKDSKLYNIDLTREVTIETRRGKIKIKIRYDNDLLPGMLFLPFCFKEAAANVLTNSELDPIGKIPELKYNAARIYQD